MTQRLGLRPLVTAERVHQGAWSVLAQALSSGSNFGLQAGLAASLAPAPFGAVVIGLSSYYLALALGRAWIGDPLAALGAGPEPEARARWSGPPANRWRRGRRRLAGIGGLAAAAVGLVAALAPEVSVELVLLALALPVLLVQDGYRYLGWSQGCPQRVAVLDGLWVVVFGAGLVGAGLLSPAGWDASVAVMAAWLTGGVVSAGAGPLLARHPAAATAALPGRAQRDRAGPAAPSDRGAARALGGSQTILALDGNGLPAAVALVAGSAVTGGLRAVTLPFLPVSSVLSALRVLTLPVLRRAVVAGHPVSTLVKVVGLNAALAAGIGGTALVAVSAIPLAWLGPTGELVKPWYPLAAVVVAARMITLPMADLLALGAGSRPAIGVRAATTTADWLATLTGAATYGLAGAIVAKAIALVSSVAIWAVATTRAMADRGSTAIGEGGELAAGGAARTQ